MTTRMRSYAVSLAALGGLAVAGCSAADRASDPAPELADTVAAAPAEAVLAGVRFDVRRDPG